MLLNDTPYVDLGVDWFDKRRPEAHARRLIQQLNHLGYRVELSPIQAA
jgi:hypothetical protein